MKPILIYFLISVIFAFFSSFIAKEKNRNSTAWFWLGFLFNAIALLALIAIPVLSKKEIRQPVKEQNKTPTQKTLSEEDKIKLMEQFGIIFKEDNYHYNEYKYSNADDAINYAKTQQS